MIIPSFQVIDVNANRKLTRDLDVNSKNSKSDQFAILQIEWDKYQKASR